MTWGERATEAAVGGVSGLVVTLVFITVTNSGVTAGDWLQFAGVFLGVAATISGTLWLQSRERRQKAAKQKQIYLDALMLTKRTLEEISSGPTNEPKASVFAAEEAFRHLTWARQQLEDCTYRLHVGTAALMTAWELQSDGMEKHAARISLDANDVDPQYELKNAADYLLKWVGWIITAANEDDEGWRSTIPSVDKVTPKTP